MPRKRGKGSGTTYYHKGSGRWCAELNLGFDAEGKPLRVRGYHKTRKEAEAWLAEQATLYHKGLLANPSSVTLKDWAMRWLERKEKEVRPRTVELYRQELGYALPSVKNPQARDPLGSLPLQKVTPSHIRSVLDDLGKRYSLRTVRQVRQRLWQVCRDALDMELIHRNPAEPVKIKAPRDQAKTKAGRALELHEVQALLSALDAHSDPRTALSLRLMLACGLRLGEALGLQWQDVDLEAGVLRVSRAYSANRITLPKTHTSARTVPIPRATLERLRAYRDWWRERLGEYPPTGMWVFPGDDPSKPLDYRAPAHLLTRVTKKLGIPHVRVHDLRHSYGSHLLANGAPLELVSERMGHANPNITLGVYRHLLQHERQGFVIDPEDLLQPRAQA
ncbi:MAG: site-specific integrase [Meiothermus sp.]|uniref:tyrosine-type recombinase/integrase n=1 Tax=Meiothermus sp. TaxID=1955249 RepID=UPI0021DBF69F|nr:site-specific integrase [Meiothermus sp.]GIW28758.1 MAG: site-specific integrase [Meiothermus sp.]